MAAIVYEASISIINMSESMFDILIQYNDREKIKIRDEEFKDSINSIKTLNNVITKNLDSIDIGNVSNIDPDIAREISTIIEENKAIDYYCEMIKKSLTFVDKIPDITIKGTVIDFLKSIYTIIDIIINESRGLKHSDYCYVERGLLKQEDIYGTQ